MEKNRRRICNESCPPITDLQHIPSSSHDAITLTRVDLPPLRPDVQVDRADQLEERIVVCFWLAFFKPLVAPDQQADEDFDLLKSKVEADAHSLTGGETMRDVVSDGWKWYRMG